MGFFEDLGPELSDRQWVIIAVLSRLVFVGFAVVLDLLVTDHQAQGVELWHEHCSGLWQPFQRWDAVHFSKIATDGYEVDYQFAFYPLWPLLLRMSMSLVSGIAESHTDCTAVVLVCSGLALNTLFIVVSTLVLKRLLFQLLCQSMGTTARQFLINAALMAHIASPSTVFFTSLYSESLFCALKWGAMLCLTHEKFAMSALLFFMASCTRSNGSLSAVFVVSWWLARCAQGKRNADWIRLLHLMLLLIATLAPSVLWSVVGYESVCSQPDGRPVPSYCASLSPVAFYAKVQEVHWDVGWLRFYQWRQIPNILLGLAPCVLVVRFAAPQWLISDCSAQSRSSETPTDIASECDEEDVGNSDALGVALSADLLVHLVVVLCFAHVNIAGRVLAASCPLFSLAFARACLSVDPKWRSLARAFWLGSLFLGTALHVNFFPWT